MVRSIDWSSVGPGAAVHAVVFAAAWFVTYNPAMVLFTGPVGGSVAALRADPRRSVLLFGVAAGVLGAFPVAFLPLVAPKPGSPAMRPILMTVLFVLGLFSVAILSALSAAIVAELRHRLRTKRETAG